jgi:hypothetical protein
MNNNYNKPVEPVKPNILLLNRPYTKEMFDFMYNEEQKRLNGINCMTQLENYLKNLDTKTIILSKIDYEVLKYDDYDEFETDIIFLIDSLFTDIKYTFF